MNKRFNIPNLSDRRLFMTIAMAAIFFAEICQSSATAERQVPIIYATDLYHPPTDPDDHFDTAVLFAIKEFDIRCIILDNVLGRQVPPGTKAEFKHRIGRPPLEQLMQISGRQVKYAPGLPQSLASPEDRALEQPSEYQGGIEMMLAELRNSEENVTLFLNGSCRDFAAAFNRDPELFRQKVKAIYVNAGIVVETGVVAQIDFNVELDPIAFFRLFDSGVPIY